MRVTELLRLVWLNINQNKFKSIMTSIGIVVGAATIVMVIGIGRGGQMDVAEQFSSLNAGAIDISYEWEGSESGNGSGFSFGGGFSFSGGGFMSGGFSPGGGQMSSMGGRGAMGGNASSDDSSVSGGFSGGVPDGDMGGFTQGNSPDSDTSSGSSRRNMSDMSKMFGGDMSDMSDMTGGEMPDMSDMTGGEMPDMSDMTGGETPDAGEIFGDEMPDRDGNSGEGGADDDDTSERSAEGDNQEESSSAEAESKRNGEDAAGQQEAAAEEAETQEDLTADRMNLENIILSAEDVEDIELFVKGITGATISYSTRSSLEGGNLTEAQTYTVAGVKSTYASLSNLEMAAGSFLTDEEDDTKARVCVLGASVAKELFGSAIEAYDSTLYIDDRAYVINGVLESTGTVSAGITPDESVFIPYETGIKYITGENISPVITVIAEDINALDDVIADVNTVLTENYSNAEFTFSDAGSKMEAAESSNEILTLLLTAMAAIVFIVGGIGIMNVLFVSVKERTGEIGILKSLGASRSIILFEFLLESAAISLMGGVLGVGLSFLVTPIVEYYSIRVEANTPAWLAALGFAVLTGTLFGIYPAWKASRLVPVEALNAE